MFRRSNTGFTGRGQSSGKLARVGSWASTHSVHGKVKTRLKLKKEHTPDYNLDEDDLRRFLLAQFPELDAKDLGLTMVRPAVSSLTGRADVFITRRTIFTTGISRKKAR